MHPPTVRAVVAEQRRAADQALLRLGRLEQPGVPGATALATGLARRNRDAFLSNAALGGLISVASQPGAVALGLFPFGTGMTQLLDDLER